MTTLQTQIPDALYQQVKQLMEREQVALDQFVTLALTAHVSAWQQRDYLAERARRGNWEKALEVLQQVPNVEPEEYDRF